MVYIYKLKYKLILLIIYTIYVYYSRFECILVKTVFNTLGAECPKEQAKSQEYFSRFLNMYRNSGFASSSSHVAQNGSGSRDGNISEQSNKSWSLFGWSLSRKNSIRELDLENAKSPSEEFVFTVPKDPFLSPYLAPDNVLAHMPPIKLLVRVCLILKYRKLIIKTIKCF